MADVLREISEESPEKSHRRKPFRFDPNMGICAVGAIPCPKSRTAVLFREQASVDIHSREQTRPFRRACQSRIRNDPPPEKHGKRICRRLIAAAYLLRIMERSWNTARRQCLLNNVRFRFRFRENAPPSGKRVLA